MEEKRKEELTKFFTVSSAVLSVLYAACILLSLLAPLLPKFIPLLAFFLFFLTLMIGLTVKEKAEDLGHMEKGRFFFVIPLIPLLMLLCCCRVQPSYGTAGQNLFCAPCVLHQFFPQRLPAHAALAETEIE